LKSALENITTIIFDLGGVVLNIDPQRAVKAFSEYSHLTKEQVLSRFVNSNWSYAFEKGEINANTFRNEIRKNLGIEISDIKIDKAWSAMLLDLPISRLQMLAGLRGAYQTFVLSNTNAIHFDEFENIVYNTTNGGKIEQFFDKVYFSHQLGLRKPEKAIYEHVLKQNNLLPEETLFIDDMEKNILGAKTVGLKTIHLTDQEYLTELFS